MTVVYGSLLLKFDLVLADLGAIGKFQPKKSYEYLIFIQKMGMYGMSFNIDFVKVLPKDLLFQLFCTKVTNQKIAKVRLSSKFLGYSHHTDFL